MYPSSIYKYVVFVCIQIHGAAVNIWEVLTELEFGLECSNATPQFVSFPSSFDPQLFTQRATQRFDILTTVGRGRKCGRIAEERFQQIGLGGPGGHIGQNQCLFSYVFVGGVPM